MILALALACGTRVDTDVADTDVADTDTDVDTDVDSEAIPADNLVNVLGDCEGLQRAPDAYPNQLIPGEELHRFTLTDPHALCNDGTPGIVYVRPATDDALRDVWSLHLQGGGGCASAEACALRWCGADYYDASKMSSSYGPEAVGAVGIFDADPRNKLAGANHAFFYYCSSDSWGGQGEAHFTSSDERVPDYAMFVRGHVIVEAGIAALEAGVTSDDGVAVMPKLADATQVVLSGTSAGSVGAIAHADWLTARLAPKGIETNAIFDAAITPTRAFWPADLQDDVVATWASQDASTSDERDAPDFVDESCAAWLEGDAEAWECGNSGYVIANHVTTPFFVRNDLRDTGGMAEYVAIAEDDHEVMMRAFLASLAGLRTTAAERADIDFVPGIYAPNCAQHVALETNDWWRVATVADGTTPTTYQDAVQRWYTGSAVAILDDAVTGAGDGPRSDCASVDGER